MEALVHKTIDRLTDLRIRQNREFFNVPPAVALDILRDIAQTLDDAKLAIHNKSSSIAGNQSKENSIQVNYSQCRRKPFRFSMINLGVGETVIFTPTGLEVKVADDKKPVNLIMLEFLASTNRQD